MQHMPWTSPHCNMCTGCSPACHMQHAPALSRTHCMGSVQGACCMWCPHQTGPECWNQRAQLVFRRDLDWPQIQHEVSVWCRCHMQYIHQTAPSAACSMHISPCALCGPCQRGSMYCIICSVRHWGQHMLYVSHRAGWRPTSSTAGWMIGLSAGWIWPRGLIFDTPTLKHVLAVKYCMLIFKCLHWTWHFLIPRGIQASLARHPSADCVYPVTSNKRRHHSNLFSYSRFKCSGIFLPAIQDTCEATAVLWFSSEC